MTKSFLALLIIPLIFFCGCEKGAEDKPRLTKEEYKDTVCSAWTEFRDATFDYAKIVGETLLDFSEYKGKSAELQETCDRMSQAFEMLEEILPPEEFGEQHERLLKSIEDEKRWVSYREESFNADTKEESDRILDKLSAETHAIPDTDNFTYIFIMLYQELGGFEND